MRVLVTGAAGFLGTRLIKALLADRDGSADSVRVIAADTVACPIEDERVERRTGSIADAGMVRSIVDRDVDVIYHLAAVVSGQAEEDFDLGMQVNLDGTRQLLEACRRLPRPPRVVFASSVAVFGTPLPPIVPEDVVVAPQSSYGVEKAIGELLVSEYSRRGFIDGIACRLPTVAVRSGSANTALSSFVSGIIREPLAGIDAVCPVPLDTSLWVCSPGIVIENLRHAGAMDTAGVGSRRMVSLPGLTVTPAAMLAALERLAGAAVRRRVRCEPDARTTRFVCSWPGALDVTRALALGFRADRDVDALVAQYIAERRGRA